MQQEKEFNKMTLSFDKKEDLRLRMMELEKKLSESEEERCKLEKTCNILMRAFREEEKMRYKALNEKYEKFLEDCSLRRRRNDIILKSLCIIEDRARALFAKTERLKVLKDRYISCLKISDIKKDEPPLAVKNFPYSSPSQKIIHDVTPKSVHWETPYASDVRQGHKIRESIEPERNVLFKYDLIGGTLPKENKQSLCEDIFTPRRILKYKSQEEDVVKYPKLWQSAFPEDHANTFDKQENLEGTLYNYKSQKSQPYLEYTTLNSDNKCGIINSTPAVKNTYLEKDLVYPVIRKREMSYSRVLNNEPEDNSIDEVTAIREKVTVTHQESIEKLKRALSVEDDEIENDKLKNNEESQKIIEKDEIEMNEKNQFLKNKLRLVNEDLNQVVINETHESPYGESKNDAVDLQTDLIEENIEDKVSENLPVGLDGVDYQNETYPESYYEQPVHHNHTSIASDVILEEDESEQDIDQNISEKEAKNSSESEKESCFSKNTNQKTSQSSDPYPEKQFIGSPDKANNPFDELNKFRNHDEMFKMDVTDFDKKEQSPKSESLHKSEKSNKRAPQSNLMHLLESDSESFQIEHGDLATGNEDSDFDFSFNQN